MKNKPNVLMFAPAFAPNFFSEALVNSKLALAMLDAGWDVTVYTASASSDFVYSGDWCDPWGPLRKIVKQFAPQTNSSGIMKLVNQGRALVSGRHPIPSAQWAQRVAASAIKMHQQKPFDLMLTRSTSCIAHLPGLIVKRKYNLPWIANWNDPPSHLFPAPYTHDISLHKRFFYERYLREVARNADLNTFPSKRLMLFLEGTLRLRHTNRSAVIPHIGLGRQTHAAKSEKTVFRICHAGNLSVERDPRDFLHAFSKSKKKHSDISLEFNLIGKMPDEIRCVVEDLGLENSVRYTPDLPFLSCLKEMEKADALLLIEAPIKNGIFFPSKIIDYCEIGRPILSISPSEGVMSDLMNQFDFGYFSEVGNPKSIQFALEKLITDWKHDKIAISGQNILRSSFEPKAVIQEFDNFILRNEQATS